METAPKPKVVAVIGPTATGKTALAIDLARRFGGEVVSADSRQVYRGLDLGTGKVTHAEMGGVPHHMIDMVAPTERYSVDRFQKAALMVIDDILARGKLPVVCGGTGQYVDSLLDLVSFPDIDPDATLRARLAPLSLVALMEELRKLDPRRAETVDPNNRPRIVRAIEIATHQGNVPPLPEPESRFDALVIGCRFEDKDAYRERIRERIVTRVADGMLDEALRLRDEGLPIERMRELGLEYRHLADWLEAGAPRDDASVAAFIDSLWIAIRGYARRQMTWFKRRTETIWLAMDDAKAAHDRAAEAVRQFLS